MATQSQKIRMFQADYQGCLNEHKQLIDNGLKKCTEEMRKDDQFEKNLMLWKINMILLGNHKVV